MRFCGALKYLHNIHIYIGRNIDVGEGGDIDSFVLKDGDYIGSSLAKIVSCGDVGERNMLRKELHSI